MPRIPGFFRLGHIRRIELAETGFLAPAVPGTFTGQELFLTGIAIGLPFFIDGVIHDFLFFLPYRGFGQEVVEELAKHAGVPVWNGLTNEYHPTQMIADMLTIREHFGDLKGRKLVYMVMPVTIWVIP